MKTQIKTSKKRTSQELRIHKCELPNHIQNYEDTDKNYQTTSRTMSIAEKKSKPHSELQRHR